MNKKLSRLAERREHLVAQAAAQRMTLAQNLAPWRAPLALADHGVAAFRYIRRSPVLSVGAVLIIAALRPQRASKWLGRIWVVWQLGRRFLRN